MFSNRFVPVLLLVATLVLPAPAAAVAVEGDDLTSVVDMSFPVAGPVQFGDDWWSSRGSRGNHRAQDLVGRRLQRIHASQGGTVCFLADDDHDIGGWELAVCGDDGRRYVYSHLNDDTPGTDDGRGGRGWAYAPGIRLGARVDRGQWIGWLGDSGNAEREGPQLHFHVQTVLTNPEDVDHRLPRLNPAPSLRAAIERGDVPAVVRPTSEERVAGATRLETAAAISRRTHEAADTVVVAPAGTPQEALLAAPLAGALHAPVLLSAPDGLATATREEVARLGASAAVVVGRPDQLGASVESDLKALGVTTIERLAAGDPLTLSTVVAEQVTRLTGRAGRVLLARGQATDPGQVWPDALSAGALAAASRTPILLTGADRLAPVVQRWLERNRPATVDVVGGERAVAPDVAALARHAAGTIDGRRLGGRTRYETSATMAEEARRLGLGTNEVWLATGRNFPDALTAGPAAAVGGGVVVLVDGVTPGAAEETSEWLVARGPEATRLVTVGGGRAVAPLVALHATELAAR